MFVTWASVYEGSTDASYFDVLLPRVLNDILLQNGARPVDVADFPAVRLGARGREIAKIASEICENQEAFALLFIHADTGGREQEKTALERAQAYVNAANELCGFLVQENTQPILPKKEMEAWALTDGDAICDALGFTGDRSILNLPAQPAQAENVPDPKAAMLHILRSVKRRVRPSDPARLLASIAQAQSLERLRLCPSFADFENGLKGRMEAKGFFR